MPPSFSAELLLVRRNPWMMALAFSPLLGALGLLLAGMLVRTAFFVLPHVTIAGIVLAYFVYRRNWQPVIEPTEVRAGPGGVTVGDRFIPRSTIRDGLVVPGRPPRVLLRRRRALSVELQTIRPEDARALLLALGLDASQTVAHFRGLSRAVSKRRYGALIGLVLGALYTVGMITVRAGGARSNPVLATTLAVTFALSFVTMLVALLAPTGIDVGADGIALRWLGTRRFYGYDQIYAVDRYEKGWGRSRQYGLTIVLQSGEEVLLPIASTSWGDEIDIAVLEERIRESREAFRQGGTAADAALLRRGERSLGDWIASLRTLGAGANADLRTAPIPRERLFRIMEDPSAPAAARAAAAVAIGGDLDDDARARLRVAAESTAAPRLRVVIEKAAGGEDGSLEEALKEVEAEEESSRAAG